MSWKCLLNEVPSNTYWKKKTVYSTLQWSNWFTYRQSDRRCKMRSASEILNILQVTRKLWRKSLEDAGPRKWRKSPSRLVASTNLELLQLQSSQLHTDNCPFHHLLGILSFSYSWQSSFCGIASYAGLPHPRLVGFEDRIQITRLCHQQLRICGHREESAYQRRHQVDLPRLYREAGNVSF